VTNASTFTGSWGGASGSSLASPIASALFIDEER
jgi:hypothetical protein